MVRWIGILLVLAKAIPTVAQQPTWLDTLIQGLPTYQRAMASAPEDVELQVLYRPLNGPNRGKTTSYQLDAKRYFYPASAVKLPMAGLALQQ